MNNDRGIEYDQLTGLYSRWHWRMAMQQILDENTNRVFISLDLDDFSQFNEQYGSAMGDELLKAIAQVLLKSYPNSTICRFSGDEFAIILAPTHYSRFNMSQMTRNLFNNLNSIHLEGLGDVHLSFSIGSVYIDPTHHKTPDEIYLEGLQRRQEAKKHEGNFLSSAYGHIPDIEGAFLSLRDDRLLYNEFNNRLFRIYNETDWMDYLKQGAQLKGTMFKRNQGHLDDIFNYFSKGGLPEFDYQLLFQLVVTNVKSLDAFMFSMLIEDILIPYYENQDLANTDIRSRLGHLYLLLADSFISVVRMGDRSKVRRIDELLTKCIEICSGLEPGTPQFEPYYYALCEIVSHYESISFIFEQRRKCDQAYEELRALLTSSTPLVLTNREEFRHFEYMVSNARFYPLYRACFLRIRENSLKPEEKNELKERLDFIRAHLVDGIYDLAGKEPEYQRLALYLQGMLLDNISDQEIFNRLSLGIKAVHQLEYGTLSQANVIIVAYLFLGASQVLLHTDLSQEEKREFSCSCFDFLLDIVRKRESIATDHQILFLTQVMIRTMVDSPILTPADKYYYLERSLATISLETYGHCKAVAAYAKVILSNMIENHPNLLAGPGRPYATIEEVKANRQNLLEFMDCACMLHDIGKMNLMPITNNAFRKLTDAEFALIRQHPIQGVSILRNEPAFEPFIPFVYTHHRWWNGEFGYPVISANEKKSPLQDLVYIMSFCDSLEAGTSHIGRNYRQAKNFLQIFDEFYVEAGTRYSSDVLQSIISSPKTYYDLRQMVDHHWKSIYQSIFQEVVSASVSGHQQILSTTLPDPYKNMSRSDKDSVLLHSLHDNLTMPQWLVQMDPETQMLYTFSLMEYNRMTVLNSDIVVFLYNVETDTMGFLSKSEDGRVNHIFAKHFSTHRLNMYISEKSYHKVIELIQRVIDDPYYPKEGKIKMEYTDNSKSLLAHYTSIINQNGKVLSIVGQIEDLNTSREKMLQTIQNQNKYMVVLDSLKQSYIAVIYTDIQYNEYEIIKGYPLLEIGAKSCGNTDEMKEFACQNLVDEEYRSGFMEFFDKTTVVERLKRQVKLTYEYHSNNRGWMHAIIMPGAYDNKTNISHLLFLIESADDEHQQQVLLTQAANYDSLTGLFNRNTGEKLISEKIALGGTQIFAILDCDHFKRINDQLSHLVGDKVLREQSRVLKECFSNNVVMRLGGDEFVVHIAGKEAYQLVNSFNGIKNLFNHFVEQIGSIRIPELESIVPTMSCGVVFTDGSVSDLTFEDLYRHADAALHESKVFRRGTVTISELHYRNFFN